VAGKKSVLIVDDDPGTCETLSDILEVNGFDVATVKSGEGCLKMVNQRRFDTVLMDIKMPGMNGVECFRKIRETDEKTKVIMMTAYAVNDLVAEAMAEGAFSVVHKPLDLDRLISLVQR
jgi:DNA-binding NtrC family response regulator